jgi:hypothetical protein
MDAHVRTRHCTLGSIAGARFWRVLGLALLAWATLASDVEAQPCPSIDPNQNYNCAIGPIYALPGWGNVPWSLPQYYQDILLGDLDGDGRDELIGRNAFGVHVWSFDTTLGTWQPWLTTNGTGVLLLPLSDAAGWNQPQYYATLQLMNLPGKPGKILAARSASGLFLFELTRGVGPVTDIPAGAWTQLTQGGPFADADCFANAKCWSAAPYYQTIRFGDIDGEPGDEVIGWGGNGIVAFKWSGTQWTGITGLPAAGDAVTAGPSAYLTLRFADVDGDPGQELLDWSVGGVTVLKYVPGKGGSWTELPIVANFGDPPCTTDNVSCWSTLQTARFGVDGVAIFMRLPGCSGNGGGMAGTVYDPNTKQWRTLFSGGPFDDCSGFIKPQYYETIQFAYITGNVVPELVGRGPGGILVYQWNGTSWVPLSTNVPALSDPLWASDPSYWRTIKTGFIQGSGQQALLARGQTGIRTWHYRDGTLERPSPTGEAGFPPFPGAQGDAYTLLNKFMGLGHPVRDSYANPAIDNTSSTLRSYISPTIVAAGHGCQDEVSANPPQYRTCDPDPAGATNPAYTLVVNQVIRELWFAAAVIDYFTTLQTMQNALFLVQGSTFPSIADNLRFSQANGQTTSVNYLGLFASIGEFLTSFPGFTEFAPLSDAMAVLASSIALFQTPQNAVFQQTYNDIQGQIASQQQAAQTNVLAQKHYVLSDYGMLSTAGQLISAQVWTLDEAAYLSASRQAFATWVYQAFLPLFWEQYQVTNCMDFDVGDVTCAPPPDGAYMESYSAGGVNFTGLLPLQAPCQPSCGGGDPPSCGVTCTFVTPAAALTSMVFNPLPPSCQYSPGSGNAWIYPAPGKAGCTLAAGPEIFANLNGWRFQVVPYNVGSWSLAIDNASRVRGIGKTGASSDVRVKGHTTLPQDLDLRTTRMAINRIVREAAGAEELINDASGNAFVPISLAADPHASASGATLATTPGASPRIRADLKYNAKRRDLNLDVSVDGGKVVRPVLCMGEPPTTRLAIELELRDATHRALLLAQVEDWLCVMDRDGNVTALRPAGMPTFGTP